MSLSNAERQKRWRQRAAKALRNAKVAAEHPDDMSFRQSPPEEEKGRYHQGTVDYAHRAVECGRMFLGTYPTFLRQLFKERPWEHERILMLGARVKPQSFEQFIKAPYPQGLEIKPDDLHKLVEAIGDAELLALYRSVTESRNQSNSQK